MKTQTLNLSISSLPAVAMSCLPAWQQKIHASSPTVQPIYREKKKKPWHSKNVNAPIYLASALEKNKTRDPREKKMKLVSRCNVMKHNSCDRLRSGREDVDVIGAVRWCCCCCCVDALVGVSLGPVKDELTRALSCLPTPKDGSPPWEKRGYLHPLSILVLTRIS